MHYLYLTLAIVLEVLATTLLGKSEGFTKWLFAMGVAVVIRCLFLFFILSPQKYSARGSLRYLVRGRDCTDSHSEHSRFQEQNRSPFCTGCGAYHRWGSGYQPIFKDKWALIIPYFLSLLLVIKINTTQMTSPTSAGLATDQPLAPLLTTLHNSFKSAANTTV